MIHIVSSVVLLLFAAADGRRETIAVHNAMNKQWEAIPADEHLQDAIQRIYNVFKKRAEIAAKAKSVAGDYTVAASMSSFFRFALKSFSCPANDKGITKDGWNWLIKTSSAFLDTPQYAALRQELAEPAEYQAGCDALFQFLKTDTKDGPCIMSQHDMAQKLTFGKVSPARTAVLKDVFVRMTGSTSTPFKKGDMPCKELKKQGFFIACIHGNCEGGDESPVSWDEFQQYYNSLGMYIESDKHFELMVVNAWHMYDGKYENVNTVNQRMRCYTAGDKSNEWVTLDEKHDCPRLLGDTAEALRRANDQKGGEVFVRCEI